MRLVTSTFSSGGADLDLGVDPGAAGVADVGAQAGPRGQGPAADQVGLHQGPGTVADHRDGLAGAEHGLGELHSLGLGAELVRVGHAAGQHQGVVVGGVGVADDPVDGEGVRLVQVVVGLGAGLWRKEFRGAARVGHGPPGLGELDLLSALVGDHESNPAAGQFAGHDSVLRSVGDIAGSKPE